MVQINFGQKQVNAKIVYYGPGMSGKTTNLEVVHQRAPQPNRGELTSISTDGDRTLFFDFMPLDLGTVAGMRTCFQIYTVPGQVYYNSTRKLVLQGVDGVVFVADSSASMTEENLESMRNLEQNLAEYGKSLSSIPLVIQYNKRDLPDALPVEELNRLLNPVNVPTFEATANSGQGVFPTLKALAALVLESIHSQQKPSGAPAPAASLSTGTTGFFKAPLPRASQPPAASAATAPALAAAGAAQQRLQQTGMHPKPNLAARLGATAGGGGAPTSIPLPGSHVPGGTDPLSRTQIHAPPHGAHVPAQQTPSQPMMGALGASPGAGLRQTGFVPRDAQLSAAPGVGLHMRPPDAAGAAGDRRAAPQAARAPQPAPARPATPRAETAPRIQPRSAPRPTPVAGSRKKSWVYTTLFVAVALGIGAVVARMIMNFI